MRAALLPLVGSRGRFRGTVERCHRTKWLIVGLTLVPGGARLASHVWLQETLEVQRAKLQPGERIEFSAFVLGYKREDGSKDVGLEDMHRIIRRGK